MKKFIDNLKKQAEENPVMVFAVGAATVTAVAKLIDANTSRQNSKAWAKEVDRRTMNTRMR